MPALIFGLLAVGAGAFIFTSSKRASAQSNGLPAGFSTDAQVAADELASYLRRVPAAQQEKRVIASYQTRMGGLTVDGIFGPRTGARMLSLISQRLQTKKGELHATAKA